MPINKGFGVEYYDLSGDKICNHYDTAHKKFAIAAAEYDVAATRISDLVNLVRQERLLGSHPAEYFDLSDIDEFEGKELKYTLIYEGTDGKIVRENYVVSVGTMSEMVE
jgi:hypothetical protein